LLRQKEPKKDYIKRKQKGQILKKQTLKNKNNKNNKRKKLYQKNNKNVLNLVSLNPLTST